MMRRSLYQHLGQALDSLVPVHDILRDTLKEAAAIDDPYGGVSLHPNPTLHVRKTASAVILDGLTHHVYVSICKWRSEMLEPQFGPTTPKRVSNLWESCANPLRELMLTSRAIANALGDPDPRLRRIWLDHGGTQRFKSEPISVAEVNLNRFDRELFDRRIAESEVAESEWMRHPYSTIRTILVDSFDPATQSLFEFRCLFDFVEEGWVALDDVLPSIEPLESYLKELNVLVKQL